MKRKFNSERFYNLVKYLVVTICLVLVLFGLSQLYDVYFGQHSKYPTWCNDLGNYATRCMGLVESLKMRMYNEGQGKIFIALSLLMLWVIVLSLHRYLFPIQKEKE